MDDDLGRVKIHFQGWAKKWDEWYSKDSDHLQSAGAKTGKAKQMQSSAVEVLPADAESLRTALAFRVKSGQSALPVTAAVEQSSKRLGQLPRGMIVVVKDREFNAKNGSRLERVFYEQTSHPSVPSAGWVSVRNREGQVAIEPVQVEGLKEMTDDDGQKGTSGKRKRKRQTEEPEEDDGVVPLLSLGPGASAGCTDCVWFRAEADDTPAMIAQRCGCRPFDLVFLNKQFYAGLTTSSRLKAGTRLRIPKKSQPVATADDNDEAGGTSSASTSAFKGLPEEEAAEDKGQSTLPLWYTAKNNQTPKLIATALGVDMKALVDLNRRRYPTLAPSSRLREGTQLRVPRGDGMEDEEDWREDPDVVAYRHWTFPDTAPEEQHPSYMMARRLVRRKRGVPGQTGSLNVTYCKPEDRRARVKAASAGSEALGAGRLSLPRAARDEEEGGKVSKEQVGAMATSLDAMRNCKDDEGRSRVDLFLELPSRKTLAVYFKVIAEPISLKEIDQRVRASGTKSKAGVTALVPPYGSMDEFEADVQKMFDNARTFNQPNSLVYIDADELEVVFRDALAKACHGAEEPSNLFNKVVTLKAAADGSHEESPYFYSLTYIPDLQWCRLAPLERRGEIAGQPKWRLRKGEEYEIDVSARRCMKIRARALRRTTDADEEEWVINADATASLRWCAH